MLTQELSNGVSYWESGSKERLQHMFATSTKEEEDGLKSFTESYHKYKREYVKHLGFNPKEENLSKCILAYPIPIFICFQLLCWSMRHWRQCTSTLTQQPMTRLRGTRR